MAHRTKKKEEKDLKDEENLKRIKEILVNDKSQRAEVFKYYSCSVFRKKILI